MTGGDGRAEEGEGRPARDEGGGTVVDEGRMREVHPLVGSPPVEGVGEWLEWPLTMRGGMDGGGEDDQGNVEEEN